MNKPTPRAAAAAVAIGIAAGAAGYAAHRVGSFTPTPSSTGFAHVTIGQFDGTARAVNVGTSDVTGTLPIANLGASGVSASQVLQWSGSAWGGAAAGGRAAVGACASRPGATGSGNLYYCVDAPLAYVDDPTLVAWAQIEGTYLPKPGASFTAYGNVNLLSIGDAIAVSATSNGNTVSGFGMTPQSLSQSSPWIVRMVGSFGTNQYNTGFPNLGACVSAGVLTSSHAYCVSTYSNSGTFGTSVDDILVGAGRFANVESGSNTLFTNTQRMFFRIENDGTELHLQISSDGYWWQDQFGITTVVGLDHYGFNMGLGSGSSVQYANGVVYSETYSAAVAQQTVTGSTGSGVPVEVTVASTSAFVAGDVAAVHGMAGNTAANTCTGSCSGGVVASSTGILVTQVNDSTHLTLNATGNGTWTSGGTVTLLSR